MAFNLFIYITGNFVPISICIIFKSFYLASFQLACPQIVERLEGAKTSKGGAPSALRVTLFGSRQARHKLERRSVLRLGSQHECEV